METAGHHMKTQHTYPRPFGTPSDSIPKLRRSSTGRPAENHLKTCWTSSGRTAEFQLGYHLKTTTTPRTSGDMLDTTWDSTSTSLEDLLCTSSETAHGDHPKTWIKPGTSGDVRDITRRPVDTIKGSTWRAPEDGITLGTSGDLLNITRDTTSTSLEDRLRSSPGTAHGDHLKTWIKPGTFGDVRQLGHHQYITGRPALLITWDSTWRSPEDLV